MVPQAANAAAGDSITVAKVSPTRNGGDQGAKILLRVKGVVPANLKLIASDLNPATNINTPDQTIGAIAAGALVADGTANDTNKTDGLDEITVTVPVTTSVVGGTAKFAIYEDEANAGSVDATEARAQVSVTTAGVPTQLVLTPTSQTAPAGVASPAYTVTVKDAAGNVTGLDGNGADNIAGNGDDEKLTLGGTAATAGVAGSVVDKLVTGGASDGVITAAELAVGDGTADFVAQNGQLGNYTVTVAGPNSTLATGSLNVVTLASIAPSELDVVSGADTWDGFGDSDPAKAFPAAGEAIRIGEASAKFDIAGGNADKNATVQVTVSSANGILFGGKTSATVSITLDANAKGSFTVTPDANTAFVGRSFRVVGSGIDTTFTYQASSFNTIKPGASVYTTKVGESTTITATAQDQFGLPITGVYLAAVRNNPANANNDDVNNVNRVAVDSTGKATFTVADPAPAASAGASDIVSFYGYKNLNLAPTTGNADVVGASTATINYTADGLGTDFTFSVDGGEAAVATNPSGTAYNPASVFVTPLVDDGANTALTPTAEGDFLNLTVTGGSVGAADKISVDNGALIVPSAGTPNITDGVASLTGTVPVLQTKTYTIVGTKTGLTTVTYTTGGRTKTAQFTVVGAGTAAARNVAVTAPAKAKSGEIAVFTAKITDAFGNPVQGVQVNRLNVQVSGPGALQDSSAISDANGVINLNVRVASNTSDAIKVTVTGLSLAAGDNQFGAAAGQLRTDLGATSAPGFTASAQTATATANPVNIEALKQAVADAQAAVDAAQAADNSAAAAVTSATAKVTKAEKAVAKAKKALKKAQKKGSGVKAAKKKLAAAKASLAAAEKALASATADKADTAAALADAKQKLADAQAALAAAQA